MPTMQEVVVPDAVFKLASGDGGAGQRLTAEDRLDLMDLVSRFEWSFDSRHFDALGEILTEDVVIDHVFGYRQGKKACLDMLRGSVNSVGIRHQATNPLVFVNDQGEPSVLSYLLVVQVVADPEGPAVPNVFVHAVVTDTCRKEGGRWRIARRTFEQMKVPDSSKMDQAARRFLEQSAIERAANGKH